MTIKKLVFKNTIKIFFFFSVILFFSASCYSQSYNILGVTLENLDNSTDPAFFSQIKASLRALPFRPTSRIVFQTDSKSPLIPNPEDYDGVVPELKNVSNIMGLILDSWYWDTLNYKRFNYQSVLKRSEAFLKNNALVKSVDIWEVGNEVNGEWLFNGNREEVQRTVASVCSLVKNARKKTAVTFYYYQPSCVGDTAFMIQNWVNSFLEIYPDAGRNIDYIFVSYYYNQCEKEEPDFKEIFSFLGSKFPFSYLGIGECGWTLNNRSDKKLETINKFYSTDIKISGSYSNYIRGNFYWTYQKDCVAGFKSNPLWLAIYNNSLNWN